MKIFPFVQTFPRFIQWYPIHGDFNVEYERPKAGFYIGDSYNLLASKDHDFNGFLFPRRVYEMG